MNVARIPEALIDEIRYKTDIVEYIGRYVPLTQKGKNYWGLCPFHNDNNPSMSVSPDKQIYKCFVCGAGGNVFRFVQDYQKIHFVEAVVQLGEELHLNMEDYKDQGPKIDPQKKKYQDIMEEALQFMEYQLWSEEGKVAQDFLNRRGYDEELIKNFRVGYASEKHPLTDFMLAKGYDIEDLLDLNLSRNVQGEYRDVFFDRVVFPIADRFGHVIAFSARAIEPNHPIKYINSSETPLYVKGESIFNYHRAHEAARKAGYVIVVEGVTDVLAFHQAGLDNVIAYLGVAVTSSHIQKTLSMTRDVVLAFDTDQAGRKASYETGLAFSEKKANVSIWYNDTEYDPDELLKNKGKKALLSCIQRKVFWLDYLLDYGQNLYSMGSFQGKRQFAEFMIEHLSSSDALTQDYYLEQIESITGLNAKILEEFLNKANFNQPEIVLPTKSDTRSNIMHAEMAILKQMLHSRQAAFHYRDQLGFMIHKKANDLALLFLDTYREREIISIADLLSHQLDEEIEELIFSVMESEAFPEYDPKMMNEYIEQIQRKLEEQGNEKLNKNVLESNSNDMKKQILYEKIYKKREGER